MRFFFYWFYLKILCVGDQIYVPKCFNKLTSLRFYSINYIFICALFFDCFLPSGISSDWVETLQVILLQYTECFKKVETSEYLGKYKFYRKMLQTKVVGFKKICLYWSYQFDFGWRRQGQTKIEFFKWNTLLLISESSSWYQEFFKTLKLFFIKYLSDYRFENYSAGISITQDDRPTAKTLWMLFRIMSWITFVKIKVTEYCFSYFHLHWKLIFM